MNLMSNRPHNEHQDRADLAICLFGRIILRLLGEGSGILQRRETEWPGWTWCTNYSSKSTWVPESWVQIDGDSCVLKRDYDATALSAVAGSFTFEVPGPMLYNPLWLKGTLFESPLLAQDTTRSGTLSRTVL